MKECSIKYTVEQLSVAHIAITTCERRGGKGIVNQGSIVTKSSTWTQNMAPWQVEEGSQMTRRPQWRILRLLWRKYTWAWAPESAGLGLCGPHRLQMVNLWEQWEGAWPMVGIMFGVNSTGLLLGTVLQGLFNRVVCFHVSDYLSHRFIHWTWNSLVRKNHVKNFWKAHPAGKSWRPAFTDLGVTLHKLAAIGEGRTECGVKEGQGGRCDGNQLPREKMSWLEMVANGVGQDGAE